MKKIITFLLRACISLTIIALLIYKLNIAKISSLLININLFMLPLFFLPILLMIFAATLNIYIILKGTSENLNFYDLLKKSFIARSISSFLPGKIGEGFLIYILKQDNIPIGKSFLALLIDKLITLILLIIFIIPGLFVFFEMNLAIQLSLFFIFLIVLICFIFISAKIRYLIRRFILRKYSRFFVGFSKELFFILRNKKYLLFLNFLITIIMLAVMAWITQLFILYFGTSISLFYVLIIQSLGILSAQIPVSLGGLGIREYVVINLYSLMGVDPVIIGTIYFIFIVFTYLLSGVVLLYNTKNLNNLLRINS